MRQAALIAVLLASVFSVALGISKSYDVVPFGGCVAEIVTVSNNGITQYYRNTLDSLTHISWWCGDAFNGGPFNVEVRDSITGLAVAHGPLQGKHATQCWAWLDFQLTEVSQPVRGRTYAVTIKNQDGLGAISFAYDPRNTYRYGNAVATGSSPSLPDSDDVAAMVAA